MLNMKKLIQTAMERPEPSFRSRAASPMTKSRASSGKRSAMMRSLALPMTDRQFSAGGWRKHDTTTSMTSLAGSESSDMTSSRNNLTSAGHRRSSRLSMTSRGTTPDPNAAAHSTWKLKRQLKAIITNVYGKGLLVRESVGNLPVYLPAYIRLC